MNIKTDAALFVVSVTVGFGVAAACVSSAPSAHPYTSITSVHTGTQPFSVVVDAQLNDQVFPGRIEADVISQQVQVCHELDTGASMDAAVSDIHSIYGYDMDDSILMMNHAVNTFCFKWSKDYATWFTSLGA